MRAILFSTCAVAAMTWGGAAVAQSTTGQAAVSSSASSTESGISDIVVTAQRRSESLQNVPIAVTALGSERLEQLGVRNINDVARVTPSLATDAANASPQFGSYLSLRGQSTNNAILQLEPTVGVYLDGVYVPAQSAFSASSVLDLERVEVLKGPQGTLYGRNTTGGAISIVTVAPKDVLEGRVSIGAGNFGHRELSGVVNVPLGDGVATRIVAGYTNDDGWARNLTDGSRLGNAQSVNARGALRVEKGAVTAILRGDYTEGRGNGVPWQLVGILPGTASSSAIGIAAETLGLPFLIALGTASNPACRVANPSQTCLDAFAAFGAGVAGSPAKALASPGAGVEPNLADKQLNGPNRMEVKTGGVSLDLSGDVGSATLHSITAMRWMRNLTDQDLDGTPYNLLFNYNDQKGRQFTQELQLLGKAADSRLDYILGAYYYDFTGHEYSTAFAFDSINPNTPNRARNDLTTRSWAVYAQATYALTDKLDFTGGLRYTDDRKTELTRNTDSANFRCQVPAADILPGETCAARYRAQADNLSYLARLSYKPVEHVMLYAVHSTGFKGGGLTTGSSTPGSFTNFGPEKVKNYEIGLKSEFLDSRVRMNLAAYWIDYDGLQRSIVRTSPSGSPITTIQNAAKARIKGAEAEITIAPVERLTFYLTGSYTDARYLSYMSGGVDKSALSFQSVSKWRGNFAVSYRMVDGPVRVDLNADVAYRSRYNLFEETLITPLADHYQEGFALVNARLAITNKATNTELSVWGANLFDKRYRSVGNALYDQVGFNATLTGMPRTFGVTATQRF